MSETQDEFDARVEREFLERKAKGLKLNQEPAKPLFYDSDDEMFQDNANTAQEQHQWVDSDDDMFEGTTQPPHQQVQPEPVQWVDSDDELNEGKNDEARAPPEKPPTSNTSEDQAKVESIYPHIDSDDELIEDRRPPPKKPPPMTKSSESSGKPTKPGRPPPPTRPPAPKRPPPATAGHKTPTASSSRAARTVGVNDVIKMKFVALNVDKKDKFGKSDPYLKIVFRKKEVFTTEVKKMTLSPVWNDFEIKIDTFCGGDVNALVIFEVYDWDKIGAHDFIGSTKVTLSEIMEGRCEWKLINPKKLPGGSKQKSGYEDSGVLQLKWHEINIQ